MFKKLLSAIFLMTLFGSMAYAQTGGVEGRITDAATGESIPTANVFLVELERGAASDFDGFYRIGNLPAGTYTLRVTFVGYRSIRQQITIQPGVTLEQNFQMQSGAIGLDELVVTGYGTISKRELTGSIASVQSREFQDVPVQNLEGALQGRAAGVTITSGSGNPGAGFQVRVRGQGSINAGNDPLYIVDGVQISFQQQSTQTEDSPLNAINPADIESIEVLKDAAAAAIYGAQAANGVVLITTKRGQQGVTRVTARTEFGQRRPIKKWRLLDSNQLFDFWIDAVGEATARGRLGFFLFGDPIAGTVQPGELETFDKQDFV
ncbi:MAG: carboxypeptidase-like regulatory domain-containing protein, partial [Balneolaceae bacterium]